jgi:hypothetical protein
MSKRATFLSLQLLLSAALCWALLLLGDAGTRQDSSLEEAPDRKAAPEPPSSRTETATSVLRDHAASGGSDPARAADDLRIRVLDAATGERSTEHAVLVSGISHREGGWSSHSVLRGRPNGAERELRVPRAALAKLPEVSELVVGIEGSFDPPIERKIPVAPWPEEPLELLVPPHGRVGVRVYTEGGELLAAAGRAYVKHLLPGRAIRTLALPIEAGTTEPFVCALDLELEVEAKLGGGREYARRAMRGPRRAGDTKWIELRPPEAAWTATVGVRLVDDTGAALCTRAVSFAWQQRILTQLRPMVRTEIRSQITQDDGRLKLPVEPEQRGAESQLELRVSYLDAERGYLQGSLEIPTPLVPGHRDLGDLVLHPSQVSVEGIVLDAHDQPVRGAWISLREQLSAASESGAYDRGSLSTDAKGRFHLADLAPGRRLRLQARAAGHQPSPIVEASAGDPEIVLRLEAPASVAGSILCPDEFPWEEVRVEVLPAEDRESLVPLHGETRVRRDRSFLVRSAPSGPVSVSFDHPSAGLLARIDGIELRAGATSHDPRLRDVALLRGGRSFALRLVDPRSTTANLPDPEIRAERDGHTIRMERNPGGEHRAWIRPEDESFFLHVPGYRTQRIVWSTSTQTIELEAGMRILLPVVAELAPMHERIDVTFLGRDGFLVAQAAVIDGLAELIVGASGTYRVELTLALRGNLFEGRLPIPLPNPLEIEIDDRPRQELAPVTLAPELLRSLLLPR